MGLMLDEIILAYYREYARHARLYRDRATAEQWIALGIPAAEAGYWASSGVSPAEAARHISAGRFDPVAVKAA